MLVVISPAKKQNFHKNNIISKATEPCFKLKTQELINILQHKSKDDLMNLMGISQDLAELNYERYQNFYNEKKVEEKQAILAFDGDVYKFLQLESYQEKELSYLQHSFRILSGLYGVLKPLDLIHPHRLEMGTKLKVDKCKNLYEFWQEEITNYINEQIQKDNHEAIINLASKEYFSVLNKAKLACHIINIEFKEFRDGKLKVIAFNAKRARSMMSNFLIKNQISNLDEIKAFKENGYKFDYELSNNGEFVFIK